MSIKYFLCKFILNKFDSDLIKNIINDNDNFYIFILQFENNKFFIDKSYNVFETIYKIYCKKGCSFTRDYMN